MRLAFRIACAAVRLRAHLALLATACLFIPISAVLAADSLSVKTVRSPLTSVAPGQIGVPLQVVVENASGAQVFVQSVVPLFTNVALNDRAIDYSMPGGPVPGVVITSGASHVFNLSIDVSQSALTDVAIRIDAAVNGYRLDTYEVLSDSSAAAPHTWIVTSDYVKAFVGIFNTRVTPVRSDDSLVVRSPVENVSFNSEHYLNGGAPIADLPLDAGASYRLVFQITPSLNWDYEPKLAGKGTCSLAGPLRGFGRSASPIPGIKELLLSDAFVEDENADSIDCVIGSTTRTDPALPWSMMSDPWTDGTLETNITAETGSLTPGTPAGAFIDCVDGSQTWELGGNCQKGRYYFYELWFQPDLEWEVGDTVDVCLHLAGRPVPTNLEQLHVRFRFVDNDTIPPAFSDFGPEIVPAGNSFDITCTITDASGVYDDGTGSLGQGVYLIWDDDGSLVDNAHEIQMSAIGGGSYTTDTPIGPRASGDVIVYTVHACDDDADGGKAYDRSCGTSDMHTVQIVSPVYLVDVPGSRYPATVYSGQGAVSIHIELDNPMSQEITLYQTSTVSFSDGTRTVKANLRNETVLPAGAVNFPVSFDTVQVPYDFIAPTTVDLRLDLAGLYGFLPFSESWTGSESNRLGVMKPHLFFTAHPVPAGDVHPGDAMIELIRIEVKNDSPAAVSIDSLVMSNATVGGGGAPMNDVDLGLLRLYAQTGEFASWSGTLGDSLVHGTAAAQDVAEQGDALGAAETVTRTLDPADSLLAWARFEGGEARLRFPGGKLIPAGTTRYWFAVADVDSFLASDGDSLDVAIVSPDSVFITGAVSVEFKKTPLNSDGESTVDGFKAFQLVVEETLPDTLYLGDADQPVLSFILPMNGHVPDVLSAVSVKNLGDSEVNDLVERLALWKDDGDGSFSPLGDLHIGDFAATGGRFELSGLSLALLAPQRFFAVADFRLGPFAALRGRFGVPAGGIEYTSQNDGPIDRDVAVSVGQLLLRREIVSIDALPVPAGARHPGDEGIELLALKVGNNTLGGVTVDSLRMRGDSALFPCESGKPFTLYADDGDSSFEPGVDTVVAEAAWSGGVAFFAGTQLAIAPGSQRILYVATALDSFLTVDGETLLVGLESPGDIGLTLGPSVRDDLFRLDADFPIVSTGGAVTDGMLAYQVTLYPHGDSVIVDQTKNVLVLDCVVPGNACLVDTLEGLTVTNLGTAGSKHIERLLLWRDNGDGLFDPGSDDSVAVFSEKAARTYTAQALSQPLAGLPGSRFFVTMDVWENVETGGTVDLAIPVMGISVASGNDGPVDRQIDAPGIFTIPVPDRLTLFTSILGNKRVMPGEEHVLNLVLGMYNSYQDSKTLRKLVLLSVGSSRLEEITKVEAYADSDEDGLFNPAIDSLLEVAQSSEVGYSFIDLGAVLKPHRSTLLFVSYETALVGIRDSIRIDFQVSDKTSIVFQGKPPTVEGDFPLNSAGVDITNGMVNAQIRMLPVSGALVSPGSVDVPCLSFMLPCDGNLGDVLEGLSIENRGTASQGQDVRYIKLWKDTGSTQFAFDSLDEFLAFLVWNGSSWRTVAPLAEPIPCGSLVLHVTADIASTAQDGRSMDLCVPLGGITVSSGNDGPIDERACGAALIEISTDPLFVSFDVPAAVTRNQDFEVRMDVANAADTTLHGVVPDSFACAGSGSCSPLSGPAPASIDIPAKSDSTFTWIFRALSTGEIVFRGRVKQNAGPEESRIGLSDTIRVDEVPENVTVTLRDLAPVSLNRGQGDISLIEMVVGYNPASGQGAPIALTAIELSVTNGAAAPLPVKDVASRVRLRDEVRVLFSVDTDAITQSSVVCPLPEPVVLSPGSSKIFRISVDISATAPASDFRLSIASSGKIALADQNSGAPIPFTGSAFPWSTNAVTLRDAASALLVRLVPTVPARVNTGQEAIRVFNLVLENGGGVSAAPVSVSEIVFTASDANGDTIDAGRLFKSFRLTGSGGNEYSYLETFAGSASIRCAVQPAVTVAAQVPVTLRGMIDCLLEPGASGFSISLRDSLDLAARDANSGQPIEVQAAAGSPGFPMGTPVSLFSHPLVSVAVGGWGRMEERIVAGTTNATALRLVLSHPGAAQESPFSCSGITVRLLDELGGPLRPVDVLDAVKVRKGTVDIASVYVNASHSSDIPLTFAPPLVASPGEADTLDVLLDLDASPARSLLQMHINAAGIDIADTTDGRKGIPLTGSFPFTSGLGRIIFPAGEVLFAATGLFPANVAAGAETGCMRLEFSRGSESSGSRVFVDSLTFEVLDEGDRVVDASLIIDALRVSDEDGEIASSWRVAAGCLEVSLGDTVAVGENETRVLTLSVTSAEKPPVKAMSLRIVSGDALSCRDEATGGPVTVAAASGAFPFGSGKAAILAREIEAAFSNYPNPFVAGSGRTTITFYMPAEGRANIRVFTITGEPVRTIAENELLAAGLHQEFSWDGRNGSGNTVLSGVYYLVLKISAGAGDYTLKRKVALVQ